MVVMGQVVPEVTVDDLAMGTEVELVIDVLYEDDDHQYLVWKWRPVTAPIGRIAWADDRSVAVLGVGMHPWGKWGRNFVEYGLAAARAALGRRRGVVERRPVRLRRRHHPQRLPRLHLGRHLRPGAGLVRRPRVERLRGVRVGCHRHRGGPGADPGRPVRRGPRGGGRHHPQGILRPGRGRTARRPRLAALPSPRRHQPHLLRPLRPPAHGALRRHRGRLRRGEGEERPRRRGQPQCPLPQGGHRRGGARLAHGGRPAAPAGDLRHLRRRRRPRAVEHGLRPPPRRRIAPRCRSRPCRR